MKQDRSLVRLRATGSDFASAPPVGFQVCLVILGCFSLVSFSNLRAQSEADVLALPPTSPDAEKVSDGSAIINYTPDEEAAPDEESAAADEISAKNEGGKTDKLPGLEPGQTVGVTLKFGASKASETIHVSAPDGGTILAPEEGLVADEEGMVRFKFQVGDQAGLYQIALRDHSHEMGVQFWVVNNETPEENPKVDLPGEEPVNSNEGE